MIWYNRHCVRTIMNLILTVPVGGNDTYGITGIPSMVGGRGIVQRVGLIGSTQIVYPGSDRGDA